MLHLAQGQRRSLLVFGALLGHLLAGLPGRAQAIVPPPANLQAANARSTAGIGVDPSSLTLSVPLGNSETRTVTVTNASNQTFAPAIYEAYPAAPNVQLRRSVPTDLRSAGLPRQSDRLDPQLLADLQAAPDHRSDFLIYLRDQADVSAAYQIDDWGARGAYVYQTLRDHAEHTQRSLRAALDARRLSYRPLWIVNAVRVRGTVDDVLALAGRSEVALVRANRVIRLIAPQSPTAASSDARCNSVNPSDPICWNIHQIGADRVWRDFGVTGHGIVVASIDTGVRYTHPALATHYRGYRGPGVYDHNYNWFDPKGIYAEPIDVSGHGTHTAGTIVANGDGTLNQPAVGVAPGAEWIAAQGCLGATCNEADLIASAQWMLAPTTLDGEQPRPDLRPMIINNSWAGTGGDDWYAGYVAAWRAAGIFPVFAAGNTGSACGSIGSPGDYANVVTVGATDQNDSIALFSARGPTADGRRKPDFVAPGASDGTIPGVLSTGISDSTPYFTLQGTSMATPHVSGVVALLWSANPALIGNYDTTYAILRETALGLNDTRCGGTIGTTNNVYGNGRINAYAAIQRARVDVPWLSIRAASGTIAPGGSINIDIDVDAAKVPGPGAYSARVLLFSSGLDQPPATMEIAMTVTPGAQPTTISGRVVSTETGTPLAAHVGVQGGQSVATDSTGVYTLTLAAGTYDLVASATAYFPSHRTVSLTSNLRLADITLAPDTPHLTVKNTTVPTSLTIGQSRPMSITLGNSGSQPLYYALRVAPDQFAATRSDEPGGPDYRWVDLPNDAGTLQLSDDGYAESVPLGIRFPFYGYTFTDTLVTANGMIAFSSPVISYLGLSSGCFPDNSFYFYEIAPFRTDLDPSSGGRIRFAVVDNTTFVLSYEQVPLHNAPAGATYTFQLLLHNDGRIVYQYQDLSTLPSVVAVGLQRAPLEYQKLGCGKTAALHNGLAIELRPQLSPTQWLHLSVASGTLLPGHQQTITATLNWAYTHIQSQHGRIEISSNDSLRSPIVLPINVDMLTAPRRYWLPWVPRAAK
jgi:subtilisin family serine protease